MNRVYIKSAVQVSLQKPLSEEWMTAPRHAAPGERVRCDDPDFRQYIPPMAARRMGLLVKRAIVTARVALEKASLAMPDAIICGTGLGCMENTERVLEALRENGEDGVSPTDFMQSVHNTVASTIAINLGCHGYNSTYSQGNVSFGSALADGFLQVACGMAGNVLVTGNDELTETTYARLKDCGYYSGAYPASELSVSMVLSSSPEGALCELYDARIFHGPKDCPGEATVLSGADCKPLFGECPVSEAAGVYMGAHIISSEQGGPVLVWNCADPDGSMVLLKKI